MRCALHAPAQHHVQKLSVHRRHLLPERVVETGRAILSNLFHHLLFRHSRLRAYQTGSYDMYNMPAAPSCTSVQAYCEARSLVLSNGVIQVTASLSNAYSRISVECVDAHSVECVDAHSINNLGTNHHSASTCDFRYLFRSLLHHQQHRHHDFTCIARVCHYLCPVLP